MVKVQGGQATTEKLLIRDKIKNRCSFSVEDRRCGIKEVYGCCT